MRLDIWSWVWKISAFEMNDTDRTPLSTHDESSVSLRGKDLTHELMGEVDFGSSIYYLMTGDEPSAGEGRVINAMLISLMAHGTTPHAMATRLTLLGEPQSIQGAVASGLLGVGSRFAGAMEQCSRELQEVADQDEVDEAVQGLVTEYRSTGTAFSGIGHPYFDPVDPRAERLFELAEAADIRGEHTQVLFRIQDEFEDETGYALPINVTGAIAAITADLGLPPEGARGIAVISRAAGLVAEVLDELETPIAMELWQNVDELASAPSNREDEHG